MTTTLLKELGEVVAELAHAYGYRTRFDGSFTVCEDMDEQSMLAAGAKLAKHHAALAERLADAERWRHARWHALEELLRAYPTNDTSDVGLDYAVDKARQAAGEAP